MKLNLLPQTVSKGRALKAAWFLGVLIMGGSLAIAIILSSTAQAKLTEAQGNADAGKQGAADAVATAAHADDIIKSSADVIRDANLSKAMIDHNDKYPQLYTDLLPYIPSFFRVNSLSASPVDATTSTVTLQGTLGSYEQYSDLILALMRFKDAKSISRSGYNYDPKIVPGLTPDDPVGIPRKPDDQPVPTDQIQRLAYLQSRAQSQNYSGTGGFGDPDVDTKGAMPGQSLVTIVLTVSRDLQAPDPQGTLAAAGSASAAAAGGTGFGGPGGAPFGAPGMGGGPPGMMGGAPGGGPPGVPPPAGAGGGGRRGASKADSGD